MTDTSVAALNSNAGMFARLAKSLGLSREDAQKALAMVNDDAASSAKSTAPTSTSMEDTVRVTDRWNTGEMHKVPTTEQLKVGPTEHASGGGAEKMVKDYSRPAPQQGIQLEAEQLAAELGQMRGYMKSVAGAHNELVDMVGKSFVETNQSIRDLTVATAAVLAKAEEKDDEEDEDEHKRHAEKAKKMFSKARKLLKAAKKMKASCKSITDPTQKAEAKAQAKSLRKSAAQGMIKAQTHALAAKGGKQDLTVETRKAISDFIDLHPSLKAEMVDAEREEDKMKFGKKKAKKAKTITVDDSAKAAADAAKSDAKGNQADKQDPATGNQDDAAAKAAADAAVAEMSKKVNDALDGLGLLKTDMQGLISTISGRPINPDVTQPLTLMKGDIAQVTDVIATRIEKAVDEGRLDQAQELTAKDMLAKYEGVRRGQLGAGVFDRMLTTAHPTVREVFNLPAAA